MKTQNIQLNYISEFNAFGTSDAEIEKLEKDDITPIISLQDEDYKRLDCPAPSPDAPTVAFLLGRDSQEENIQGTIVKKAYYTIDWNYAKAIAQSGVNIRFLTYKNNVSQMENVDGLILPGGCFVSPNEFYTDPLKKVDAQPGSRSYAYITSIMEAEKKGLPMLGICAGAQMIGGMHGLRLYRDLKEYTHTNLEHKTKELEAHIVSIREDSPLFKLLGSSKLETNSRHNEALMNNDSISDLKIYATSNDSTPEAWGNEEKNILCIQWHPEDFAAKGDKTMQKIYNWLADKAHIYQKQKSFKKQNLNPFIKKSGLDRN